MTNLKHNIATTMQQHRGDYAVKQNATDQQTPQTPDIESNCQHHNSNSMPKTQMLMAQQNEKTKPDTTSTSTTARYPHHSK
jgi:hypothetical protein